MPLAPRDHPRRALIAAYFFPPSGGAGVQRTLKFVKYLPQSGWATTVLTTAACDYWMQDDTLTADLPVNQEILRTRAVTGVGLVSSLQRLIGHRGGSRRGGAVKRLARLSQWFAIPDSYVGWVPFALPVARSRLRQGDIDLLLTTSSPDSAHLIGLLLRPRPVPWVADFRDPWTQRLTFEPPTPAHRRAHEFLERRVLEQADRVLVTCDRTAADYRRRYPRVPPAKIVTITNGFDDEDFSDAPPVTFPTPTIVHTGQLTGRRTIEPLLSGLSALAARDSSGRCGVTVLLIGPRDAENEERVRRRGLGDVVRFVDPMPHREVIRFQRGAHAVLLLESDDPRGSLVLPGKVFEYLAARRPIVAIAPDGAVRDLLGPLGAALMAPPGDPQAVADILARVVAGELPPPCAQEALAPFARRTLTGRLAAVFEEVVGEHRRQGGRHLRGLFRPN